MTAIDDICSYASRKLEGSGLNFAAVVWLDGKADQKTSVGIATPSGKEPDAAQAMTTIIQDLKDRGVTA